MEQRKIFCGPSKILKNILRLISNCLKCFMTPTKTLRSISYILNVRSLSMSSDAEEIVTEIETKTLWDVSSTNNNKRPIGYNSITLGGGTYCPPAKLFQETGASSRHINRACQMKWRLMHCKNFVHAQQILLLTAAFR